MKKINQLILMLAIIGWSNFLEAQQAGTLDQSFMPATPTGVVQTSALQTDGKIIIGGDFDTGITRLNEDGSIDNTFLIGSGFDTTVFAIAIQSDGKIIIGGCFNTYNGINCKGIVRLNENGSLDTTFTTGTGIDTVGTQIYGAFPAIMALAIQADGKIIIGGSFSNYNGAAINNLARLNVNGTLDTAFTPVAPYYVTTGVFGPDGSVSTVAIQNDGKILIGGHFCYTYHEPTMPGIEFSHCFIARLHSDGTKDSTFIVNIGPINVGYVSVIKLQTDDKILVGGSFQTCNGTPTGSLLRLNPDATLDTTFVGQTQYPYIEVHALDIQADGKLIVGCLKTMSFSSDTTALVFRLNANGRIDTTFHRGIVDISNIVNWWGSGASDVYKIQIQSDDKIIIGGSFISYDGATRNGIARLNGSSPLSVDNRLLQDENKLNIFPNPSSGIFNLELQQEMRNATISIIDVLGKEIHHSIVDKQTFALNIDLANHNKGVYYLIVNTNDKQYKSKLVIN